MSRLRFFVNSTVMMAIAVVGFSLLLNNQALNNRTAIFGFAAAAFGTIGAGYIAGYVHAAERARR